MTKNESDIIKCLFPIILCPKTTNICYFLYAEKLADSSKENFMQCPLVCISKYNIPFSFLLVKITRITPQFPHVHTLHQAKIYEKSEETYLGALGPALCFCNK